MPVYPFDCETCGSFDVLRPMDEAARPAGCPTCGGAARRVYTPPGLARLAAPGPSPLDVEEGSAHEPDVVSSKHGRRLAHHHGHSPPWVLSH